jgi:hypothetical protein
MSAATTIHSVDAIVQEIAIKASASRVFEALIDPAQRMKWWGQKGRFETTNVESDFRPGGRWLMSGVGMGRPFKSKASIGSSNVRAYSPSPGCRLGTKMRPRRWCGSIWMNKTALRRFD